MKTWLTPTAVEDKFIPNEAVSTCYAVACDWSEANKYEDRFGLKGTDSFINDKGEWVGKVLHTSGGCGKAENQVLAVNNGNIVSMKEVSNDPNHIATTACQLYTDSNYSSPAPGLAFIDGQRIYWTTTATKPKRTWHHQGVINHLNNSKSLS
ncbi:hypothetical protein [Catenibacterium mitsuokai]|uniref:hypothetical protein n=1 Tax=Catenibacterium mitsuokai TaxID=100886 RepID=UPI0022E7879D|nr:hypothetical protein [Catenibacterium mitsuokai]